MVKIKRLCKKGKLPTHNEAAQILKQLGTNPEVCETCKIRPCVYGLYVFSSKEQLQALKGE